MGPNYGLYLCFNFDINKKIPVYDTIFLDAISAFKVDDFRKTILYSAISIESILTNFISQKYESLKSEDEFSASYRFTKITVAGQNTVKKDPIYEKLFSFQNFSMLLHELPLYILNKSLLIENENLYRDAISVYKTRNKIAHLGDIPLGSEKVLPLNKEGAIKALKCACNIFKWLGIDDIYIWHC